MDNKIQPEQVTTGGDDKREEYANEPQSIMNMMMRPEPMSIDSTVQPQRPSEAYEPPSARTGDGAVTDRRSGISDRPQVKQPEGTTTAVNFYTNARTTQNASR